MSDIDAQVTVSSLGTRLIAARERNGWSVADAASRLHCDAAVIDALEQERFDELGAFVYARGHVRRYAELVGESAPELQDLLARRMQNAPHLPDLTRVPKAERPADTRSLVGPVIAGAAALVIATAVWWVLKGNRNVSDLMPVDAPAAVVGPAPAPAAASAPAVPEGAAAGAANGAADVSPAAAAPNAPTSADQIIATEHNLGGCRACRGDSGQRLRSRCGRRPPPPHPASTAVAATAGAAVVGDLQLRLSASGDSWIEAYDPAGKRIFFGMATPNSVQQISGAAPLRVLLGNVRSIKLEANGKPVAIPEDVRRGSSAWFAVDADGQVRIAADLGAGSRSGDSRAAAASGTKPASDAKPAASRKPRSTKPDATRKPARP